MARQASQKSAGSLRHGRCDGRRNGFTVLELLVTVTIVSILATISVQAVPYALDLARLSYTESSLRTISDAIIQYEAMATDLPEGFVKVAELKSLLGTYVAQLPTVDGWGNDLYYESIRLPWIHRGRDTSRTFRVYSHGKDGIPDAEIVTGRWVDFGSDVVIESGEFLQTKW